MIQICQKQSKYKYDTWPINIRCFFCLVTWGLPYESFFLSPVWPSSLYILDLKIHKKIHTGDYPFGCSTFTYTFSHFGVLKSHSRIHIERKTFHRHKCENIFTLREAFVRQYEWGTHKWIITLATYVTIPYVCVGTLRHILLRFTRRFTQEMSLLTAPLEHTSFLILVC